MSGFILEIGLITVFARLIYQNCNENRIRDLCLTML